LKLWNPEKAFEQPENSERIILEF